MNKIYQISKNVFFGLLWIIIALFLLSVAVEVSSAKILMKSLAREENHNYIPEITELRKDGKLSEALEMSRFVLRHPDMPGQGEAKELEAQIDKEVCSLVGRSKRAVSGFIKGSGTSIEELGGAVASDMIIYGDIRDLIKQGCFRITGKETDPVVTALATIGLMTETVDAADWAPAVLKAFRKVGALSNKFADFVISSCKKSAKTRKLDGALKTSFGNIKVLTDKMGLARTAAVMKHVDTPEDLSAIAKVADQSADAAYFTVKNGGKEGVDIVRSLGSSAAGAEVMEAAAKKGPRAIKWLAKGGKWRKHVIRVRFTSRILKSIRLGRLRQALMEMARKSRLVGLGVWLAVLVTGLCGVIKFIDAGKGAMHGRFPPAAETPETQP